MPCFCFGQASFESALLKGDAAAALAHLQDDPLTTARTVFHHGDTLWHIAAAGGHLPLLQAVTARLTAVWPTPEPDPHHPHDQSQSQEQQLYPQRHQQPQQQQQYQQHPPMAAAAPPAAAFPQRRPHPFQRLSDGLLGRAPDTSHLPLAAFINMPNKLGQTALMTACKAGHPDCVRFLMSMGANAWYRDRAHCTALHYATLHDQGPCIDTILQHPGSARPPPGTRPSLLRLVDLPNFCGYTPAHFAAAANKPRALAALLAGGANIAARCWSEGSDWISGPSGSTPLHLAARRGDVGLCGIVMSHYWEVLRDSGTPDPRLHADARGLRPYQRAPERGCRELVEMLMPSTPLTYIFGADVVRLYKVPKLKALASAALQAALLAQINELEAATAERRRLVTAAAVAAARAAAAINAGAAAGGVDANSVACSPGGAAVGAAPSLSRASSLVSGALQFVRRQSLRSLQSLRHTLRSSRRWLGGDGGDDDLASRELHGVTAYTSTVGGASDDGPSRFSLYSTVGGGGGADRTISAVRGLASYITATMPRRNGVSPFIGLVGPVSRASAAAAALAGGAADYGGLAVFSEPAAAAVAAAAKNSDAPLLRAGSERSAPLGPTEATVAAVDADGDSRGPVAGSAAAAVLPIAAANVAATAGRRGVATAALPDGISPVRGSSPCDSDQLPFLPSEWSPPYMGLSTGGGGGIIAAAEQPTPQPALGMPATQAGRNATLEGPSVAVWTGLAANGGGDRGDGTSAATGRVAGGRPVGSPPLDTLGYRLHHCPVLLPKQISSALPPPSRLPAAAAGAQQLASPFAMPALQAKPLGRGSGTPAGGSPTSKSGSIAAVELPPHPPSQPMLPAFPGDSMGLQTVSEGDPSVADGDACFSSNGIDDGGTSGVTARAGRRANKVVLQPSSWLALPRGEDVRRRSSPNARSSDRGSTNGLRSLEHAAVRGIAAAGGGGGDPAGGSPPLSGAFLLPGALGRERETFRNVGGGAAAASRRCSGWPQGSPCRVAAAGADAGGTASTGVSGATIDAGGGGAAAGGGRGSAAAIALAETFGSDTSEDYCGICFERPALLHIQPCGHSLCAACSREVIRMVEAQPPSCPFCRGVVWGFGS